VRARTCALCTPLTVEDQIVQSMPDASPAKWHLGHTTWFFEAVVLGINDQGRSQLFNSYYESFGTRIDRLRRGTLSRPSLEDVHAYRREIDQRVSDAIDKLPHDLIELGIHHEQQHQELILADAKHALGTQPLRPAYRSDLATPPVEGSEDGWHGFEGGIVEIGAKEGFSFDNERPRHRVVIEPFQIAKQAITNGDIQCFIAAGGYRDPAWWLADGWARAQADRWEAPLYWQGEDHYTHYTLGGVRRVEPGGVACHLSYYEADAIARWKGARLPTEAEWEFAAAGHDPDQGNFADDDHLHPGSSAFMFGDVWEWTQSAYAPYPGFRTAAGAVGEYNGKFMSGQQVLRGGSCLTPRGHVRASYRNFFPPHTRWQMSGARLAKDGCP
jgi:ergothioneine biosynthesis protein EgtB